MPAPTRPGIGQHGDVAPGGSQASLAHSSRSRHVVETAFQRLQPGRAAMMAIITAIVSYITIQLFRKFVERDVETI